MPRAFSSGSRSVSTPVSAPTSAVLPWSMCPAVPSVSGGAAIARAQPSDSRPREYRWIARRENPPYPCRRLLGRGIDEPGPQVALGVEQIGAVPHRPLVVGRVLERRRREPPEELRAGVLAAAHVQR